MIAYLREFFLQQGCNRTYWLGFSGGLDSHVLLSICVALRKELPLKINAIHINHQLSKNAEKWALHCQMICKNYEVNYFSQQIQLDISGESLEEIAREKRYAIFANYLKEDDMLLTAHQQDDQAETMLMQLFRGAGPKGLAAMPFIKSFAKGFHARPLLSFSRAQLKQYADEQTLCFIEDESNQNLKFSRNFIRHSLMPNIKTHFPAAIKSIVRSANHCAESQVLLEKFALTEIKKSVGSRENTLSVATLLSQDEALIRLILRCWISQHGYLLPNTKKLNEIIRTVLSAKKDRTPCVSWHDVMVRRYKDDIYLLKQFKKHDKQRMDWHVEQPLFLENLGILFSKPSTSRGLHADIKQVSVQFRRGGEIVKKRYAHSLKNLFQEWSVPPWERDRIPLIFIKDQLIAVTGYFIHDAFAAKENEAGYELILKLADNPELPLR